SSDAPHGLVASARARRAAVRGVDVAVGRDGWRRIFDGRRASRLVDGVPHHARRAHSRRAARRGPAGVDRRSARSGGCGRRRRDNWRTRCGMDLSQEPILALARSPSLGAPVVLARGRLLSAVLLVLAATMVSALAAVRLSGETRLDDLFFGATRHPLITAMIETLGTERTAVVIYLVQRSFDAVLAATAVTPVFVWLLGSSAIQASARLAGLRRPYLPFLTFFGYAAALTLIPSNAASLALGSGPTVGAQIAQLVGLACLVWLGVIAYRGVR